MERHAFGRTLSEQGVVRDIFSWLGLNHDTVDASNAPEITWLTNEEAALAKANAEGKPVLIDIFIAEAGFAEGLQQRLLGVRRPGRRERQQQDEGAVHV